jgi:hypothetical protein
MLMSLALSLSMMSAPIKVEVRQTGGKWAMYRGGQPYFVRGVGGFENFAKLKALGANSARGWGTDQSTEQVLDEAYKNGISITVGIWLMHPTKDWSYDNPAQVKEQFERVRADVRRLKSHPAVLAWGLGNEMEINSDTPQLWKAVGAIAKMVKEEDPNHPTMTVTADISEQKIKNIQQYAPDIDILGINSYGGLISIPERLKQAGWTKPYVVTEFGPKGPWEVEKTSWNAPLEQNSTEKAAKYRADYEHAISGQPGWCLGSYAFLWGEKQEGTPTWFGLKLKTGEYVEAVDDLSQLWSGKWPKSRAPKIEAFEFAAKRREVTPGQSLTATMRASDANGDTLTYRWTLKPEVGEMKYAGEGEKRPEAIESELARQTGATVRFVAPSVPGPYRLYVTILDGKGRAATANEPFLVKK